MCAECYFSNCPPGCPNYEPPPHDDQCSLCGEGMYRWDDCVVNDWELICMDCMYELSQEQVANLLQIKWRTATQSTEICHFCQEAVEEKEEFTVIDGNIYHKTCLMDAEMDALLELCDAEYEPRSQYY